MPSMAHHTFSGSCRLTPVSPPQGHGTLEGMPPLNAHFFYSSPIPLDDPLSTATIVGVTDSRTHKAPLRPFSPGDNNALEKAWLALGSDSCRRDHSRALRNRSPSSSLSQENAAKLDAVIHNLAVKHRLKHEREGQDATPVTATPTALPDSTVPVCCAELLIDASAELRSEFCALVRKRERLLDQDRVVEGVMSTLERLRSGASNADVAAGMKEQTVSSAALKVPATVPDTYEEGRNDRSRAASVAEVIPTTPAAHDDGISGKPFVRVGAENTPQSSPVGSLLRGTPVAEGRALPNAAGNIDSRRRQPSDGHNETNSRRHREDTMMEDSTDIPVGVSRLHKVALPVLQMKPIYWSPVNDISTVMRSTWFYK